MNDAPPHQTLLHTDVSGPVCTERLIESGAPSRTHTLEVSLHLCQRAAHQRARLGLLEQQAVKTGQRGAARGQRVDGWRLQMKSDPQRVDLDTFF